MISGIMIYLDELTRHAQGIGRWPNWTAVDEFLECVPLLESAILYVQADRGTDKPDFDLKIWVATTVGVESDKVDQTYPHASERCP